MANSIVTYSASNLVSRSGGNPSSTALSAAMATLVTDAAAISSTALAAAMSVLVADGAVPTQVHVATANTALTAYLATVTTATADVTSTNTALTAYLASATTAQAGEVVIAYDTTLTKNQIVIALAALLQQIEGIN